MEEVRGNLSPEILLNLRRTSARFFQSEATGSILLLISTSAALVWANSRWSSWYFHVLHTKIGFLWNSSTFSLSFDHWINEGLMALFFFVVGLEIKREIVAGQLSTVKRAVLPVAAAAGGMVVPALIYASLNRGGEGARGWGIPMATDIAFSLGVLALVGPKVPSGLRLLLTALAIADDLGAVVVIALFYTDHIRVSFLAGAAGCGLLLALATRLKVKRVMVYAVLVIGAWVCVLVSGIHATLAGILVAMVVPVRSRIPPKRLVAIISSGLAKLQMNLSDKIAALNVDQMEVLTDLRVATRDVVPAGLAFENYFHPVTAFVILPIFALFNAGVVLNGSVVAAFSNPVGLGVLLGLFIGKQLGITVATWIVVRCRLAKLPAGVNWGQVHGVAILAGVGFTMALFLTDLAIGEERLVMVSKSAVLAASALCAVCGFWVLRFAVRESAG